MTNVPEVESGVGDIAQCFVGVALWIVVLHGRLNPGQAGQVTSGQHIHIGVLAPLLTHTYSKRQKTIRIVGIILLGN